jgi:hypothetical protein
MELKQMKIIIFAMKNYPYLQDFISPIPVKKLNIHYHKNSMLKLAWIVAHDPFRAANLCFGDFLNTMGLFLGVTLPGNTVELSPPKSTSFFQGPFIWHSSESPKKWKGLCLHSPEKFYPLSFISFFTQGKD